MSQAQKMSRGRPRDPEKDRTIIRAAQHLFLERGFEGASVDAVAEAAGVSKATIYARFSDKTDLFKAALIDKCDGFLEGAAFDFGPHTNVRDELITIGKAFLALVLDPDAVSMNQIVMRNPDAAQIFYDHAVGYTKLKMTRFLEQENARGRLNVRDPERAAWRFMGAVKGEAHMRAMLNLPMRPQEELNAHVEACVDDFVRAHGI